MFIQVNSEIIFLSVNHASLVKPSTQVRIKVKTIMNTSKMNIFLILLPNSRVKINPTRGRKRIAKDKLVSVNSFIGYSFKESTSSMLIELKVL